MRQLNCTANYNGHKLTARLYVGEMNGQYNQPPRSGGGNQKEKNIMTQETWKEITKEIIRQKEKQERETIMTGYEAIEYAEEHNLLLCKYTDPIEEFRDDVTPNEAQEIAGEDPELIFLDLNIDI